ncbi:MAG: tetratricopeptide repeat protein, partial [Pirellulales bacterium]
APSIAVPPAEVGVPKTYQNPFARRSTSPRFVTPRLQPGPLSRWHRSEQSSPPPTDQQPIHAMADDAQAATDQWDLSGPLAVQEQRTTLFALPEDGGATAQSSTPPDPSHFGANDLAQPAWLVPNESNRTSATEATAESIQQARAAAQPPADPFEETEAAEVVVSDDAPAAEAAQHVATAPIARPLPPPAAHDADQWYAQAEHAAAEATATNELAAVVHLCQRGLDCRPDAELASKLRSLAAWACNRSGEIESDQRRDDEAFKAFELAIQWDPNCGLALHNRAISRAQQGDLEGALSDFNRALELNPGLAIAYRNRGELLAATSRTDEAVADYTTALAQLPQDADLHAMRGEAYHRLGQYGNAIADLTQSIEIAPQNAVAYSQRGNVYAEVGDYQRAIADFRQALAVDAQSAEVHRSLAWLLATCPDGRFRNPRQALASAQRAASLAAPGDPFMLDALAAALASAGDFDRAVRCQQEAISNVPGDFAGPFHARLALYEQHRPFRNGAGNAPRDNVVDDNIRAASLEAAARSPR